MQAQQPIGKVGVQDATVRGALEVQNGQAILVGNTTVIARDHTAEVALSRGGTVRVCATSGLHVTAGKSVAAPEPLMLALDRGAVEVQMAATTGDTCVENRGVQAPILNVADQFGESTYQLQAGQHVMFEHGSLKEVVDHESSSCGCPPEPTMTVADALINSGKPETPGTGDPAKTAAEQHPFPAAISEGLAPPAAVPQTPPGAVHAQVSATLSSNGGPDSTTSPVAPSETTATAATVPTSVANGTPDAAAPPAPATQPQGGLVHAVGRFFRRLFGRS